MPLARQGFDGEEDDSLGRLGSGGWFRRGLAALGAAGAEPALARAQRHDRLAHDVNRRAGDEDEHKKML